MSTSRQNPAIHGEDVATAGRQADPGLPAAVARVQSHWGVRAVQIWLDGGGLRMAAAMSFYAMLSAAPLMVVVVAGLGWWLDKNMVQGQLFQHVTEIMGPRAAELLMQATRSATTPSEGLIASAIAFVVLLSGASGVFVALQDALQAIWGARAEKKPWWHIAVVRARGVGYLLVLGLLLLVSLVVSAALSIISTWLNQYLPMAGVWRWVNEGVSLALVVVLFFGLMRICDGRKPASRFLWAGAACAALMFTLGKSLMAAYLSGAAMVSAYGAAGSLVVLLMWMYFSFAILLLGAGVAKALALAKAPAESGEEGRADTFVGG
jgi:membrane protein